ncbi:hypothetical protein ACHQM5_029903 [Ranunculus cassubicifolius]
MKIIFWNARGILKKKARNRLKRLVRKYNPDLVGIVEPKISTDRISPNMLIALGLNGKIISNGSSEHLANIWILWADRMQEPNIIAWSKQQITVGVEGNVVTMVHARSLREKGRLYGRNSKIKILYSHGQ